MNRACFAALTVGLSATLVMAQPVQWRVEDGGNGHWYEFSSEVFFSFASAQAFAVSRGGHLATPTSGAENGFVASVASGDGWLGGFQDLSAIDYSEPGGGWRWVTGEPWAFTAWQPGEPNNGNGPDALAYWRYGQIRNPYWNDVPLVDPPVWAKRAIIEWEADCNNDGIVDKGQILSGELVDANNNGIPDGPGIAVQPADQASAEGASVSFNVQVTASQGCTPPITYRWQRRNPAIADPAAPGAWFDLADDGTFANTDRPTMTVLRPGPAIATGYRCKIGGGCGCEPGQGGFVYTDTVNFSVACPADFNTDGGIDFGDVEAFFERWENGC